MKTVFLICGVSGSGKSWVCRQLTDKFCYIPQDEHYFDLIATCLRTHTDKPFITECPFAERRVRENFEKAYFLVKPFFVIEPLQIVTMRYLEREGKALPESAKTRASTILSRALEWKAPYGSSFQILSLLKSLKV